MQDARKMKLNAMHFHAWQKGLKTRTYYLRTQAARAAVQMGLRQFTKESVSTKEERLQPYSRTLNPITDCAIEGVLFQQTVLYLSQLQWFLRIQSRKKRCQHKRLCKRLKLVASTI